MEAKNQDLNQFLSGSALKVLDDKVPFTFPAMLDMLMIDAFLIPFSVFKPLVKDFVIVNTDCNNKLTNEFIECESKTNE